MECLTLKGKSDGQAKGVGLVSPLVSVIDSLLDQISGKAPVFSLFISTGFVSLVGMEERVPEQILRGMGTNDSFISEMVGTFSRETDWLQHFGPGYRSSNNECTSPYCDVGVQPGAGRGGAWSASWYASGCRHYFGKQSSWG